MKTKTLSLILAIAMLLCGCQTATAQSVPAAPAVEASEPQIESESTAPEKETEPAEDEAEEPSAPKEIEAIEKVYVNGVEVIPKEEILNSDYSEIKGSANGINGYVYCVDWIYKAVVVRDTEEHGYVLANYKKRSKPKIEFCFIDNDRIGCLTSKEFTVYDFPVGETPKLSFSCNLPEDKECKYLDVWYDADRDEYAAAYQITEYESEEIWITSDGTHHVEIVRFDSNGIKIDGFTVDVLNDDRTTIYRGNYENGKLCFTSGGNLEGAYQSYYITYDEL